MCQSPLKAGACACGGAGSAACAVAPSSALPSATQASREWKSARIATNLIDVIPGSVIGHLQKRLRIAPARVKFGRWLARLQLLPGLTLEVTGPDLPEHCRTHVELILHVRAGTRRAQAGDDP